MYIFAGKPLIAAAAIGLASAAWGATPYCFVPIDDTYISMYPTEADNNYGASGSLVIRNQIGHPTHTNHWQVDTLLKFDVSTFPQTETVAKATLYLWYYDHGDNNPAGRTLVMHQLTEDWDEMVVTWNTQPTRAVPPGATCPVPATEGKWMEFDVTEDVKDFVTGQVDNFGWVVTDPAPYGTFNIPATKLRSMEYEEFVPYLLVETTCIADLDGSGDIGFGDLTMLLSQWGVCP